MSDHEDKAAPVQEGILFQWMPQAKIPLFLRVSPDEMTGEEESFFRAFSFEKVKEDQLAMGEDSLTIQVKRAGPKLREQIGHGPSSNLYGREIHQVHRRSGMSYQTYRMQEHGLLVFSYQEKQWEWGLLKELGKEERRDLDTHVMNRILSYALIQWGYLGFFGQKTKQGLHVTTSSLSKGEAFYINPTAQTLISKSAIDQMSSFHFLRSDLTFFEKKSKMRPWELLSFLSLKMTLLDGAGVSAQGRKTLEKLVTFSDGEVCSPDEVLGPGHNLSQEV